MPRGIRFDGVCNAKIKREICPHCGKKGYHFKHRMGGQYWTCMYCRKIDWVK